MRFVSSYYDHVAQLNATFWWMIGHTQQLNYAMGIFFSKVHWSATICLLGSALTVQWRNSFSFWIHALYASSIIPRSLWINWRGFSECLGEVSLPCTILCRSYRTLMFSCFECLNTGFVFKLDSFRNIKGHIWAVKSGMWFMVRSWKCGKLMLSCSI